MLGLDDTFYLARCRKCELLYQNPAIRAEDLGNHYPDQYEPYRRVDVFPDSIGRSARRWLREKQGYLHLEELPSRSRCHRLARRLLKEPAWLGRWMSGMQLLPDYVSGGSLLEIACAAGNRLSLFRDLGWSNLRGLELNTRAARVAVERGFDVVPGPVERTIDEIEDESLDVVVASMVLEHLENPFGLTRRIAAKLKKGGQFLFSTVVADAPDCALYREYWYNLDLPRHFTLFRTKDLESLLLDDLRIESTYSIPDADDYRGSARYRLRREPRALDRFILRAGVPVLSLCWILGFLKISSRIAVRARKIR
jgi:SAM-dependent methyltransferase